MAEVKGLREALEVLRKLPEGVAPQGGGPIRRALMKASLPWKAQAEQNAARLGPGVHNFGKVSYRLKDSIIRVRDTEPERDGFFERVFVSYNNRRAWWGAFVENGTEKQSAQPFLRPVLDQAGDEPIKIFSRALEKDIARITKRLAK